MSAFLGRERWSAVLRQRLSSRAEADGGFDHFYFNGAGDVAFFAQECG